MTMYHEGNRALQQQFGSEALADRLAERARTRFTDADKTFIEDSMFFFLATADAEGRPDCSHKGGPKGFAHVAAPDLLVFPDYDGNGMFKSLGNIRANPNVGLLFIAMGEAPRRLRVNGIAEIVFDDPLLSTMPGAQLLVRVTPRHIFPNCPRYIHRVAFVEASAYTPQANCAPREPAWKSFDDYKDVVPPRAKTPS